MDQRQIAESLLATMYNSVIEAQNNVQRLAESSASSGALECGSWAGFSVVPHSKIAFRPSVGGDFDGL